MNRFSFFSLVLLLVAATAVAQPAPGNTAPQPVHWTYAASSGADGKYAITARASIDKGWKLFSVTMKDSDPNTRIVPDSGLTVSTIREQGALKSGKDPVLGEVIRYFEDTVSISFDAQRLNPKKKLAGIIRYMAIKGDSIAGPEEVPFAFSEDAAGHLLARQSLLEESAADANALKRSAINVDQPLANCGGTGAEHSQSLWKIFLLGIVGGLVGLIMPCTFPMIPLTVSFFTKKSGDKTKGVKNAFLYGFFIFLIYVLISLPFYFLDQGSSGILNNIATNAWLNIGFAVVFITFALSFFGLFEITLPSKFSNTADAKASIGSIGGIFFMALTLVIVSFSCTGPILGTLLVGAINGGALQLTVAMAGFGLALGLPFALFALFPNWLASLPKSGGWMTTVKIVFGFVELALALKYLSNADLVMHWGLLKREVFFGLWILIAAALSLYLGGILKFSYDPPPAQLPGPRKAAAIAFGLFAIYLLPGLTNTRYANISFVSGFPPPLTYSLYKQPNEADVVVINDYQKALELAKKLNKPVLVDFTGWACVNCRKMEENVWPDKRISDLIGKNFVRVSLYVDDRKVLPEDQQFLFTSGDGSKKPIKTVGDKFITLQTENFKNASQPLYALISPDEKILNLPVGYTPNVNEYAAWLQCGLDAFHKSK
jgi:thiol:disulfide interchange protein DsbD